MEKAMRRMGMKMPEMTEIPAEEVIIKTAEKNIIIKNPNVSKVNMMGQETFQITGEVTEEEEGKFSEGDIEMVMEQTGADEASATSALEETGDIADAILKLNQDK